MNVQPTAPPASNAKLDQLRAMLDNPKLTREDKLQAAARQFETVMLREVVKQTMKPLVEGALTGEGAGQGIYEYFMHESLADGLSKGGGFGLADSLVQQLAMGGAPQSPAAHNAPDPATPEQPPSTPSL